MRWSVCGRTVLSYRLVLCNAFPAGTYGTSTGLKTATCTALCPGGTYGSEAGLTTSSCTATCSAGFACPPGSTNSTAVICSLGKYSLGAVGVCTSCSAGLYGDTLGLSSASCTSQCPPGRYGLLGQTTSNCSGPCSAGYYCPAGATNATILPCPPGQYSVAGMVGVVDCGWCYHHLPGAEKPSHATVCWSWV